MIYDDDEGCYRNCGAGTWASPCNGSFECASCNPGYYCGGGCVGPIACLPGTSLGEFGGSSSDDCDPCPDGHFASEAGSATCSPCPAGHSCSSAAAAPVACLAGEFASAGALSCSVCADGNYNMLEAQQFCQACPVGHECPDKTSEPTRCSSGSYSSGNATACEVCPAGSYCSNTGSSPEVCTEGSYSLDNWAYCVSCPPGQFCFNTNQVCAGLSLYINTVMLSMCCFPFHRQTSAIFITGQQECASWAALLNVRMIGRSSPSGCTAGTQLGVIFLPYNVQFCPEQFSMLWPRLLFLGRLPPLQPLTSRFLRNKTPLAPQQLSPHCLSRRHDRRSRPSRDFCASLFLKSQFSKERCLYMSL